jgi:hypothetical protein
MILNAYAVLDLFVATLRLGTAVLVLWLGMSACRAWARAAPAPEEVKALEDRCYLLYLLAGLLLIFSVASWPLLYLLLQSYVPEWPGVMCIYGVTRIGAGSLGASRYLPPLLSTLQGTKPALVFVSGFWLVLYLLNRATRTAPLTGRVLFVLLTLGLVAGADAAAEITYLAIPKKEQHLARGCCTGVLDQETAERFSPRALVGGDNIGRLYAVYYGVNVAMVLALGSYLALRRRRLPRGWLPPLLLAAVATVVVNGVFLSEAEAPRILHLPYHHCPYDLLPRAPESLVAVALYIGACFAVGWACLAAWLGARREALPLLPTMVGRLLFLALVGYLGSLLMTSVELMLA